MKDWNGHISLQSGPRSSMIAGENPTNYRRGILTKQNSTPAMKVPFPVIETVPKLNDSTGIPRPPGSSRFRRFSNPIRHLSKPLSGTSTTPIHEAEPYPGGPSRLERPPLRGTRSHSPMPRYQQARTNDTNKTHLRSFIDMGVAPGQRPATHRSSLRPTMNVEKVKRLARAAVRTSHSVVEWGRNLAGLKKEKSDLL
ncbi:hypothetical protein SERLA73DRAFT_180294 [Serpula lacrymans var. lacrymans S7.3]|uniref:Uncharacterized protein n=2 Tax=Serpula lacrymans var. lacrymans TaxID=341189 RepID=F8PU20_SERL3|nr:uncharacterized protein SERLADRAFT_465814 [Serpula lacrymans var. lacrymans S7.9]EGN99959.1 hypothetical protein SERLA73DRAFT_180294 [Serpula lacrymans var. lacrymans S7.3]EGO25524.1 hypothetical protein SERLADRAFT_465814 [Serpula lacrymans var. lacrymans S7.9]